VLQACESAPAEDLAAQHLRTIREALHRVSRAAIEDRPVMQAYSATIDYLMLTMGQLDIEQLRVLFLNPRNILIADEVMARGTIDAAPIYPREILKRALDLGATALILAHNHPSGDPKPSAADIEATRTIVEGGRALGVVLHDHLILSRSGWVSLRAERLLGEQGNAQA
jgi:DNA repair protein RadC